MKAKFSVFTTLLLLTINVFAQKTEKVTYSVDIPSYKEIYYVLKDAKNIKHGAYTKKGKGFSIQGQFDQNVRVGIWESFNKEGELEQRIDFTKDTVLFAKNFPVESYIAGDSLKRKPEQPPLLLGGLPMYMGYLVSSMRYPGEAVRKKVTGKVFISATITQKGEIIDERIQDGPGFGLNEEALRVIKTLPDEWFPAKQNGRSVDTKVVLVVFFMLAN